MNGKNREENKSSWDLEKFAEIMLKRDQIILERDEERNEKRDDRLSAEMANLAKQVAKLVTVTTLSQNEHQQTREQQIKTDETFKNHGKRIYSMEKQILELELTGKFKDQGMKIKEINAEKKSDNIEKIKIGVLIVVLSSLILIYFKSNEKPEINRPQTTIKTPY